MEAAVPDKSLNVRQVQGPPPTRMATPMTTGWSPIQGGTLDDVLDPPSPPDTTNSAPGRAGKQRRRP
jgi:hypothetical protein